MALREIQLFLNRNKVLRVKVSLPKDVGLYLLNHQRKHLLRIEQDFSAEILVTMSDTLRQGQIQIDPVESS
jgi:Ribonuclease G/E